ncbi:ribose-5-phosphate isomerase rki1 [Cryptotrichosporon argae]
MAAQPGYIPPEQPTSASHQLPTSTPLAVLPAIEAAKRLAAYAAVDDHVGLQHKLIGIGSGSTVPYVVDRLVAQGPAANAGRIFIPTGFQSKELIIKAGLTLGDVDQYPDLDVTIDGADEVDNALNAIKGGGACQLREKVLAEAAATWIMVADYRKNSDVLGTTWTQGIPIEVAPFAYAKVLTNLAAMGAIATLPSGKPGLALRMGKMKAGPVVSDNGNFIIDAPFPREQMLKPAELLTRIKMLTGVVEVGLFCNMAKAAYFGNDDGSVTARAADGSTKHIASAPGCSRRVLAERHYFTCDGEMLAWAQTWYTEAFYITAEASYDAAASTGPVQPPSSVWDTVAVCARSISAAEASAGASASAAGSSGSGSTKAAAAAQTASSSSTISASASTVSSLIPASTLGPLSPSTSAGSNIAAVGLASTDRCAGNWDYQAWAAVSSIVLTCVLGAAVWALWAGLRARLPLYAPRAYLLRPDLRPAWPSLAAFFLPFLDLPELAPPLSSAHLVLRVHWAALRLASLAALVALATVLPLTVAGVPCLSLTAPANSLGGRLGTLNDLSLLRLLDAQNPADSSTGRIATRALVEALHSARARLIAIVALTALTAGSSIFLLARLQFRLFRYGRRHAELRGGQEMVVLRNEWEVVNQATMGSRLGAAKEHGVDIAGVFAVPYVAHAA